MNASTPALRLSICITTLNRGSFIGETLESILVQTTNECEVVVLDGASVDDTEEVVSAYMRRFDCLRYIRQETNNGLDQDYDSVVELARGEYCWLMTDDDLFKPGAVAAILRRLCSDLSLIIVNSESTNISMSKSKVLHRRWLDFEADRNYGPNEMERLFMEVGPVLKYIGCFVVKRAIWLARDRQRHYGSLFNYLGIIFQQSLPGETLVVAEPLISYRWGNDHAWSGSVFQTRMIRFPSLVWSLGISDAAKSRLCSREPWRKTQELLYCRALGYYSLTQYHQWIRPRVRSIQETLTPILVALLPGSLVNALFVLYYSTASRLVGGVWEPEVILTFMRQSPYYVQNWRIFKRVASVRDDLLRLCE